MAAAGAAVGASVAGTDVSAVPPQAAKTVIATMMAGKAITLSILSFPMTVNGCLNAQAADPVDLIVP